MIVHFGSRTAFTTTLKSRVAEYVATQENRTIQRRMALKTAVIFIWSAASYLTYLLVADEWWWVALCAVSMGFASAGIGMAVMHDANHGGYPAGPRMRRMLGFSLDLLGGSSYIWRFQHNVNHHTFTNVAHADNDISIGNLARLSPVQPQRAWHRWQHLYLWPLYSLLALSWAMWADWRDYFSGGIGENAFPRPKGHEAWIFWLGKSLWVLGWFVVPLLFHEWPLVLLFTLTSYLLTGLMLGVVFQLAHVVESVAFPDIDRRDPHTKREFFAHQVATTADFAPNNAALNWYLSGLNFQIEHHLFPKLCHLHYPHIAPIVRKTCREFGMPYHLYPKLSEALTSHVRWLRFMGQSPVASNTGQEDIDEGYAARLARPS